MRCWKEAAFVLFQIWGKPITTKSDSARMSADAIAWATARGYLTTEVAPWTRDYGNLLKVTCKGLHFLEETFRGLDREGILEIVSGEFIKEDGQQPGTFRLD